MKQYLFFDKNHDKTIFQYKLNYPWLLLAIIMLGLAIKVINTEESCLMLTFLLSGLFCFPGIPLIVKNYKKAYYIKLADRYVVCSGKINNLLGKTKITYQELYYIETGREEPIIYPYGTTTRQMVKEFGRYVNVYNKQKKYMFSFRENLEIINKLLEKNPNIHIVEILKEYHV